MAVSRLARRLANRLAKAVGFANKKENCRFADVGIHQVIRKTSRAQFRNITRDMLRAARAEDEALFGKTPSRLPQPKHLRNAD